MAGELSTLGIKVKYCIETTAGTRPTSSFTELVGVVSVPEQNSAPNGLDCTPLSETIAHRYIPGLKDNGTDFSMNVNFTASMKTAWESLVTSATSAWASNKATWWEVNVPNFGSYFFSGLPQTLGLPALEVDSVFQGDVHITPYETVGWANAST